MGRALAFLTIVLCGVSACMAQSSSLFNRARNGQFGSNQPSAAQRAAPTAAKDKRPDEAQQADQPSSQPKIEQPAATVAATAHVPAGMSSVGEKKQAGPALAAGAVIQTSDQAAAGAAAASAAVQAGSLAATPAASAAAAGPLAGPISRAVPVQPAAVSDPTVTPAAAALQQVSFIATLPPAARQFRTHDLITIIVREETTYQSDGETELEKSASIDAKLEKWFKTSWSNPPLKAVELGTTPELKASGKREFDGEGTVKRKDSFVGRLTAEIIDIKPNGTLVLSARKFIKTDAEEQLFQLSGTCRVGDITADNTILSTQLADLSVSKTHKGAIRDSTERGFLPWLTDKINPW